MYYGYYFVVDNKLFLNKGALKFEDVTAMARIPQDSGWSTGVSVIDINNDSLLDIYISKVFHYPFEKFVRPFYQTQVYR